MEQFLDQYGYLALLVGTFLEGETAILIASSLIHAGLFEVPWTVLVAFMGSFISDWIYYLIGRLNGKYFIDRRPKLKKRVEPVTTFFQRHQVKVLFTYRFLYGLRIIIPLVIGMSGIKPMRYLVYSIIAGLFWASCVSTVGYLAGRFFEIETSIFEDNIIFVVAGFASLGLLIGLAVQQLAKDRIQVNSLRNR